VELYPIGLAEERALFGSDDRGVFVVSVSKGKGKRLFVDMKNAASVVDVDYDKASATWREVKATMREAKGVNWILIGGLIGGAVLILIASVVAYRISRLVRSKNAALSSQAVGKGGITK
jgi:hypothetical protein